MISLADFSTESGFSPLLETWFMLSAAKRSIYIIGWVSKMLLLSSNYVFLLFALFSTVALWTLQAAVNTSLQYNSCSFPAPFSFFTNARNA